MEVDLTWHSEDRPYHYGITTRYEISARVTGSIRVGDDVISVDGPGQRDHSWAVRDWWAFEWCWSAGGLDDGTRFHLSDIRLADAAVGFGYLIDPAAGWVPARRIEADEDVDDLGLPLVARLRIEPFGTGERGDEAAGSLAITAEPIAVSPLLFVADDGRESRFPACCAGTPRPMVAVVPAGPNGTNRSERKADGNDAP